MKGLILLLLIASAFTDPLRVSRINRHKTAAMQAYAEGRYDEAVAHYHYLIDSLGVTDDDALLNLGHSYFRLNQSVKAKEAYTLAAAGSNPVIQSVAHQQLGVIANREGKYQQALQHFRSALMANANNEEARYNYELLRKKLKNPNQPQQNEQQKNNENNDSNEKQQNENQNEKSSANRKPEEQKQPLQQNQPGNSETMEKQQQGKSQEENNIKPEAEKGERKSEIDPQKAREILETMRNREVQYLQQQKRKATRPRDKSKPDW
ncbi:MAG: hypothetical protein KatS3mg032_2202 [Cyclobacteriaceae bacterium]|nr:MAG: hypothetical protein KatS3mg032_2202 [Cyclobacteriaceae bacterium]